MFRVWLVVGTLFAAPALAQDSDNEGRALFEAGRHAFDDGRFDEALELFERAHRQSGRSSLFYNIGLAADRAGHEQRALTAYEQFVRDVPDSPRARMVRGRIEVLRGRLQEAQATELPEPEESGESSEPQTANRTWIATPVLGAASLATAITAIAVYRRADNDFESWRDRCPPECSNSAADSIDRRVRTAQGLTGVASALAVSTVIALILEARTSVSADVDRNGAWVELRHAF